MRIRSGENELTIVESRRTRVPDREERRRGKKTLGRGEEGRGINAGKNEEIKGKQIEMTGWGGRGVRCR